MILIILLVAPTEKGGFESHGAVKSHKHVANKEKTVAKTSNVRNQVPNRVADSFFGINLIAELHFHPKTEKTLTRYPRQNLIRHC